MELGGAAGTSAILGAMADYSATKKRFLALTPVEQAPILRQLRDFMAFTSAMCTALLLVVQVLLAEAVMKPETSIPAKKIALEAMSRAGLKELPSICRPRSRACRACCRSARSRSSA